ncbi:hypothetical protein GMES_0497 [Paraglaciecola mesophila KMM 241]|uniref:Uncharacterized protein n=1 Tax=Paraglaciecola mesophila KMM 241 TaxID=1128912 RepID=K6Z1G3_9ALTE|nr:hypothetical protein GMES_0497 [Paraglaciecola mesophila KMM 241]
MYTCFHGLPLSKAVSLSNPKLNTIRKLNSIYAINAACRKEPGILM